MNSKEKDDLIKELKSQIRELREKVSLSVPNELNNMPEKGFGLFIKNNHYHIAELEFNPDDKVARVVGILEIKPNPKSYSIMRSKAVEYLHTKLINVLRVITS